jgi:2-dehydro-3-deoxygluconokinase
MMNGKVLSFGEVLLRMSPLTGGAWIDRHTMPTFIGGAEANVATALASWAVPTKYVTAMPDNYLGDDVLRYFNARGIDTSSIHRSGNRVGIYYLQQGADLKNAGVIYDRFYSSFYDFRPGMIDWDAALNGVSWFNLSAISPALNEHLPAVCLEALQAARAKGCTISLDLNYRAKLWKWGSRPDQVMPELAQYCNVIMGNIWAANTLLGVPVASDADVTYGRQQLIEHAQRTSAEIIRRFPQCTAVANTFRFETNEAGLEYYTTLYKDGQQVVSPHFTTTQVVDKIGSGDCFMAGVIYGLYNGLSPQATIDFAAAAAFGKLSEVGDATSQSVSQVQQTLQQNVTRQESAGT